MHISKLPHKRAYAQAMRKLRAMPAAGLVMFSGDSIPVPLARRKIQQALDHRINSRAGNDAANIEIDIELQRDARALDDRLQRRVSVYRFTTPWMNERFGHLLSSRHDD